MNIIELIKSEEVKHLKLIDNHPIKPFDCGVEDLNDFLHNDSKLHLKHLHHTTFILESQEETIAFYSLANDVLRISCVEDFELEMDGYKIDPVYSERFFKQQNFPAAKIGRLGVNIKY